MSVSISGDGSLSGIDQGFNIVGIITASTGVRITDGGLVVTAPNATPFVINASGSVGIGTTNPGDKLHVEGGNIRIQNSDPYLTFSDTTIASSSYRIGVSQYVEGDFYIAKYSGSAYQYDTFYIDSSKNVLIGATSATGTASQKLQVTGGAYVSGSVGIGTNSPVNRFHATQYTANTDVATFQIGSASAYTGFINCRVGTTGSGTFIGGLYTPDGSLTGLQGTNGLIFSTSGSNLERVRITSSGNVGINSTAPRSALDVGGELILGRQDSSQEGGQVSLCRSSDNTSTWSIDAYGSTSTPSLRFVDNIAGAARMSVDGSGRVTTPYQPAFQAFSTSNVAIPSGTNVLPFNSTNFNIGSCYNTSTYRFTAPVSGIYLFSVNLNLYSTPGIMMPAVRINGSSFYYGTRLSSTINGDNNVNLTIILSLSINDYVESLSANQGSSASISSLAAWTRFEGYLLG